MRSLFADRAAAFAMGALAAVGYHDAIVIVAVRHKNGRVDLAGTAGIHSGKTLEHLTRELVLASTRERAA